MRRSNVKYCYPGYRYCGPKCSGPGKPTNPVDHCCMLHDRCYEKTGNLKLCDQAFEQCLKPYKNSSTSMGRNAIFFSNVIKFKSRFY